MLYHRIDSSLNAGTGVGIQESFGCRNSNGVRTSSSGGVRRWFAKHRDTAISFEGEKSLLCVAKQSSGL